MSLRLDASGDTLSRALGTGLDITSFTIALWTYYVTDRGGSNEQPVVVVGASGSTADAYLTWDNGGNQAALGTYDGSDFADINLASRLPTVTWGFQFLRSSTGTGQLEAGWKRPADASFVKNSSSRAAAATFSGRTLYLGRDPFGSWSNMRVGAVYIYDHALTDSELISQMGQRAPIKSAWAYFPMTAATAANNLTDQSGNGRDLSSAGTLTVEANDPAPDGLLGALSQTLEAASASVTGSLAIRGALSQSLGALVASGAGSLANSGTLSATLGSLTSVASGSVAMRGQVSVTLEAATLTATGGSSNSGVLSQTLAALTASGAGSLSVSGSLAATLGNVSISATSKLAITAATSVTLASVTLTATGETGEQEPIEGVLSATLGGLTLQATGQGGQPQPEHNFTSSGSSTTWSHKTASRIAREAERARKKHRQVRPIIAQQVATIFGGTVQAQAAAQEAVAMELPKSGPVTADSVARALMQAQLILEMQDEEDTFLLLAAA